MTTATATAPATGWLVPAARQGWSWADWADHHMQDAFCLSVIQAADEEVLLDLEDLQRLLHLHGVTVGAYGQDLDEGRAQGAAVLPLSHAGQALAFLGY